MTDQDYIAKRNRLIPHAARAAQARVGKKESELRNGVKRGTEQTRYSHDFFSEYFHEEMDKMWEQEKAKEG